MESVNRSARHHSFRTYITRKTVRVLWRVVMAAVAVVFSISVFLPGVVSASAISVPSVKITAAVGFNGFYDRYGWVPIKLTFDDVQTTEDVVVQVVVDDAFDATRNAVGALEWGVHLEKGKVTTKDLAIPGWVVYSNGVVNCLVNNQVVSQTRLSGNELGQVAFVGVLSNRAEAAQFLTGSTNGTGGLPVLPMTFAPNALPTYANLLATFTAIVSTPDELEQMNNVNRQGLLEWVKLGGLLVVTGTTPDPPPWEASILPLLPGTSHKAPGALFARFAGTTTAPAKAVSVSTAGLNTDAQLLAGTQTIPLVAEITMGRGTVVETAFSPSEPALLTWSNNASLWTQVLGRIHVQPLSALPPKLTAQPIDSLASASAVLAPLRVPSLPFWGIMFAVYVLAVGPLLFWVLRRFRREPWGWIVLPVVSLFTTLTMYGFGVQERPQGLLTEGVGVFDLVGDGAAEGYGVRSFMSPSIGPVDVSSSAQMLVLPMSQKDVHSLSQGPSVIHGTYTVVHYPQVGRWTVHDVISSGAVVNQGQVDMQLWSSGKQLTGAVANETPYQLHDVALCWNGKLIMLGDLSPGAAVNVSQSTSNTSVDGSYLASYGSYNHDLTRGIGRSLSNYAAQVNLLAGSRDRGDVLLVATTTDRTPGVPSITSDLRTSSDHTLVLVREFGNVAIYPVAGAITQ